MEIRIPEVGESVFEALVAKWHRKNGERVTRDEPICEIGRASCRERVCLLV